MENNKKVLITGITGQDGANMVDYLLKNTNVIIYGTVRKLVDFKHKNIVNHSNNPNLKIVQLDITDSQSIINNIKEIQPDFFVNFAAQSFVGTSWKQPLLTFNTNATPIINILETIREYCPNCRFYSAGSSEEFGDIDYSPQDLSHKRKPRSPYGASKCAAGHIVKVYRESYNMYAIHSILFNHEGVRRGEEFVTRKITIGLARIKELIDTLELYSSKPNTHIKNPIVPLELGNIYARRDWSDSDDFVEAIWLMLQQDTPRDYLLSSNETHSIKDFINIACDCIGIKNTKWNIDENNPLNTTLTKNINGKDVVIIKINKDFFRPAEVDILCGDSNETRKILNWEPKSTFIDLVNKMVQNDKKKVDEDNR
jgi:GDPmannose 4,6-dehydratase